VFGPIASNWFGRYERYGWADHDGVPLYPLARAGPYAVNAVLRAVASPPSAFAGVEGTAGEADGLPVERDGMAGARTARRAVVVPTIPLCTRRHRVSGLHGRLTAFANCFQGRTYRKS
jgi:hypothetical protein